MRRRGKRFAKRKTPTSCRDTFGCPAYLSCHGKECFTGSPPLFALSLLLMCRYMLLYVENGKTPSRLQQLRLAHVGSRLHVFSPDDVFQTDTVSINYFSTLTKIFISGP